MKIISIVGMFFVLCLSGGLQGVLPEGNVAKVVNLLMQEPSTIRTNSILRLLQNLDPEDVGESFFDGQDYKLGGLDSCYQGATMLHLAVVYGNPTIVQALIKSDTALPLLKNFRGDTPFDLALALNRRNLLPLLKS